MAFDYEAAYKKLSEQSSSLREELATLKAAQNDDLPGAYSIMQGKIDRQRKALDILNRKVLSQRLRLRTIVQLGRDLTKEEYEQAKAKLEHDNLALQGRVVEYEAIA